jgi:hypothetical protein
MNANQNQTAETNPAVETVQDEAAKQSKAQKAMRAQLAKAIVQIDEAANCEKLTDWEKGFLGDLGTRLKQYGLSTRMSAAQLMVMNRCIGKAAIAA